MNKAAVEPCVIDASAVLALLLAEPGADMVAAFLPTATISAVNASETLAKLIEKGMPLAAASASLADLNIPCTDFDLRLATATAALREPTRTLGLSLGDRACLALAQKLKLPVLTTDRNWAKLSIGVKVLLAR